MSLYTEKKTHLIYEAEEYEDFVIARPLAEGYEQAIQKLSLPEFEEAFEEYAGIEAHIKKELLN